MKFCTRFAVATCVAGLVFAAACPAAELFDLSQVRLLEGPFLEAARLNRQQLLLHDPNRLLAPFLEEAGLEPKAPRYPSWESMGLGGQTAGHYMTALANLAASMDDAECRERLDYMVSELARCQQANGNGYVGGIPDHERIWAEVAAGNPEVGGFSLAGGWVPLYNLHKTFGGLIDAYRTAGNAQAREVVVALADWLAGVVADLDDEQLQRILDSEHGGMNEVLADVAEITGDDKYLQLARRFCHRDILDPLARGEDRLTGLHANTQVPKVVGFERIAQLADDQSMHRAAVTFWDAVVNGRTLAFGGNSISEHFPAPDSSMEWIEHREGPETCNTYNMMRLTELLFANSPEGRYADFYERAMLNHILSSQHPTQGGYVYFTPARPRHYRVYSQAEQSFWCCVGSGMENHTKYGRFIYAHTADELLVNLFVASTLDWHAMGVQLRQETSFPDEPTTKLTIECEEPTKFTLKIRYPAWVADQNLTIRINGEQHPVGGEPGTYVAIDRTWRDGDTVEIETPMHIAVESLPHVDEYVAIEYGPVVLAAKTSEDDLDGLFGGTQRREHIALGPLKPVDEAPMLVASRDELPSLIEPGAGEPLTFTLAQAIRPDTFDSLKLIPFFRLHDARYMLYWRLASPAEYEQVLAETRAAEQARLALDRRTVDLVTPGEQQPESDHNFRGERTEMGIWRDRHFRHARGHFSYDLKTDGQRNLVLRLTYWGGDRRQFDVLVNDQRLAEVNLQASSPGEFIERDYPIPAGMLRAAGSGPLTVKFAARRGSMAGGIYEVRLLEQE